eukprot:14155112-Alexandrium_andersonii.AAC.1
MPYLDAPAPAPQSRAKSVHARACVRACVRAWCFEDAVRVPWEHSEDAVRVMRGCCRGASTVL